MTTKIQDMVEAEAQRAEAENPDEAEPEVEPEAEPDEGAAEDEGAADEGEAAEAEEPSAPEVEANAAMVGDFNKEAERHGNALVKLLQKHGAFFSPCPHCDGVGAIFGEVDPLGYLRMADGEMPCPDCDGYGYQRHPSKSADLDIRRKGCPRCATQGWVAKPEPAYVAPPGNISFAPPPPTPSWNPVTQQWETANGVPTYVAPVSTPGY